MYFCPHGGQMITAIWGLVSYCQSRQCLKNRCPAMGKNFFYLGKCIAAKGFCQLEAGQPGKKP
jgi:hypothetical protein